MSTYLVSYVSGGNELNRSGLDSWGSYSSRMRSELGEVSQGTLDRWRHRLLLSHSRFYLVA